MEARLSAVQKSLVGVVVGSVLVALITLPRLENRSISAAQTELSELASKHRLDAVQSARLEEAQAGAPLAMGELRDTYKGRHAPRVRFPDDGRILPLPQVRIGNLSDLLRQATPEARATIALPDASHLASGLGLRLAAAQRTGVFSLESVALVPHPALSAEHAQRELEVARLRLSSLEEKGKLDKLEKKFAVAEYRVEARKKRRSKSLTKFVEALDEARVQRDEQAQRYAAAREEFESAARAHDASLPTDTAPHALGALPQVAFAEIRGSYGKDALVIRVPVALAQKELALAPRADIPIDLPKLRAAGLWDAVQGIAPAAGVAHVAAQYNWHQKGLSLLGLSIPPGVILQGLPCLLPLLLLLLNRRVRDAATSHRLFAGNAPTNLKRAGLKTPALEWLALVALPVLASLLAATALLLVGAFPLLPVLAAGASLPLGIRACSLLESLRALNVSIVQYHSFPPPAMPSFSDPALQ